MGSKPAGFAANARLWTGFSCNPAKVNFTKIVEELDTGNELNDTHAAEAVRIADIPSTIEKRSIVRVGFMVLDTAITSLVIQTLGLLLWLRKSKGMVGVGVPVLDRLNEIRRRLARSDVDISDFRP